MVIAGLWHGAAMRFVLWGALHGSFLVIDKLRARFAPKWNHFRAVTSSLGWFVTMLSVFIAWILFRNPNFEDFKSILVSIATFHNGPYLIPDVLLVGMATTAICLLDFAEVKFSSRVKASNPIMKGLIFGFLVLISLVYRSNTIVPFIYFRF
jgi:alginate O-acetyltransferase complex protein AlgI